MDHKSLEIGLQGLPISAIRAYESIGSTMDAAAHWLEEDASDLSLVVANQQTAGRGRLSRGWHTQPDAALAFSLILKPPIPSTSELQGENLTSTSGLMARLTALGALAVCQALKVGYGLPAEIKWPNDVLLERRKVCGVLVETQWQENVMQAAIMGIGINVALSSVPDPPLVFFPATCIQGVLGRPVDRIELLRDVLIRLIEWRPYVLKPDFLKAWENDLAFRGEWMQVVETVSDPASPGYERVSMQQKVQILGLETDGSLKGRTQDGEMIVLRNGELRLSPDSKKDIY